MFFHNFKYRLKTVFHAKEEVFWILIFPILLGTCFYAAFSNVTESTENFSTINVAIVLDDNSQSESIKEVFNSMSVDENEDGLLSITYCDINNAKSLLNKEDITGIIQFTENSPEIIVNEDGINESILKAIVDKYVQSADILANIGQKNPEALANVIDSIYNEVEYITTNNLSDGNMDMFTDYYYSLIAMTCLFGSLSGQSCAEKLKANISAQGMRKSLTPANRLVLILSDFSATYLLQIVANAILVCYLNFVLKINLGANFWLIMLTVATGSLIGVSMGIFIGSIPKISSTIKLTIISASTLFSSFLSGLMVGGIKYNIEEYIPIVNKLNPATIITDALYSLNVYDTYERFTVCIISLVAYCVIFCVASYLMTRRESYASL